MQGIKRWQEADNNTGRHAGRRTGKQVSNTAGTSDRTARQAYMQEISRGQEVDKKTGWHAGGWTGKQLSNTAKQSPEYEPICGNCLAALQADGSIAAVVLQQAQALKSRRTRGAEIVHKKL